MMRSVLNPGKIHSYILHKDLIIRIILCYVLHFVCICAYILPYNLMRKYDDHHDHDHHHDYHDYHDGHDYIRLGFDDNIFGLGINLRGNLSYF